jgi:hypothetical protein
MAEQEKTGISGVLTQMIDGPLKFIGIKEGEPSGLVEKGTVVAAIGLGSIAAYNRAVVKPRFAGVMGKDRFNQAVDGSFHTKLLIGKI